MQPRLEVKDRGKRAKAGRRTSRGVEVDDDRSEHLTDLGNARRLVARAGCDFRFCPEGAFGGWLHWDGRRWAPDATAAIMRAAKTTTAAMLAEAAKLEDPIAQRELARHALKSQAVERLRAMVKLAESEPTIPVRQAQLDADPWLLNVLNGTIDLRTGELRPHRRENLITKLAPVAHDARATCPTFDAFLARIFNKNVDLIAFVQRAIGYALTADVTERVLFILWGGGKNGKTTLLEAIRDTLGDYAQRTPTQTLLVKRDGAVPNDVARLKGARFVTASEANDGGCLNEAFVKDLTGGDTVVARFLYREFFEFKPEFKLFFSTNYMPKIRGTDDAIWDRIRLVPFTVRIPDDEVDKKLGKKLKAEGSGILRWAIDGCCAWQRDGLGTAEPVKTATASYRADMDVIGRFLDECCVIRQGAKARAQDLFHAYKLWAEANEEETLTQKAFGNALTKRGFGRIHSQHGWWRIGITLLTHPDRSDPSSHISETRKPREAQPGESGQHRSDGSGAAPALKLVRKQQRDRHSGR